MRRDIAEYASAAAILAPLALGIVAIALSGKRHWGAPILALPALLFGLALIAALFNNPAGYGILGALIYGPLLLTVSFIAIARWRRRRNA